MINFTGFVIIVLVIGVMATLPFIAAWQGSYVNLINQTQSSTTQADPTTSQWTTETTSWTTTASQTSITSTTTQTNSFWNPNSQKVADLVVTWGYDPQVQMLHDINEPGCNDYVGSLPCDATFWTTSDNVPTCWTLQDYGYASIGQACKNKNIAMGAFQEPQDGMRYEAYVGSPIIVGNPGDQHEIFLNSGQLVACPNPPCPGFSYGTLSNGQKYNIQSDAWNNGGKGTPNPNTSVDIAGPQAVNMWLRGNYQLGNLIATNLIQRWDGFGVNGPNTYSTWQLGQVMFVMRIYSMDSNSSLVTLDNGQSTTYKAVFAQMVNELWILQDTQGYLPNSYTASGSLGGHDPENMDAGLLPFSYSVISMVRADYGKYAMSSAPN